jgi:hypothetical protein
MSVAGYNSYPKAAGVLINHEEKPVLITARQTIDQLVENERVVL